MGRSSLQVCGWREHFGAAEMRVSHESIYRDVYMPSRKALYASLSTACALIARYVSARQAVLLRPWSNPQTQLHPRVRAVEADSREVAGHRKRLPGRRGGDARCRREWLTSLRNVNGMSPAVR